MFSMGKGQNECILGDTAYAACDPALCGVVIRKAVYCKGLSMKNLREWESVIAKGNKAFFAVSEAFLTIKREKLWEGHGKSFSDYCLQRWGLSQSEVSRYVRAAEVLENLKDFGTQPENEGQARVLGRLAPERQREVWKRSLRKVTASAPSSIEEVAGLHHGTAVSGEQEDAPQKRRPRFGSSLEPSMH